jgi:hypothetical protein
MSQTLVLDPNVLKDRRFQFAAAPFGGRKMISFKGAYFPEEVIRLMLGFKSFVSASATLNGIEVANMIRKGQLTPGLCPFAQFAALAA